MEFQILFDRINHGFCSHPVEYPWSSYLSCISVKPTRLKRDAVVGWFDSEVHFKSLHNNKIETENLENWLELNLEHQVLNIKN